MRDQWALEGAIRTLAVALALVAGAVLSHQVLYVRVLVPRLPGLHSVPLPLWLAVLSPIWLTGLAGGAYLNSWRGIAVAAFLAAMAMGAYETWAAQVGQLGFGQSLAVEGPAYFWTVWLGVTTGLLLSVLATGRLGRRGIQRLTSN